jgi:predicted amidohydrolase YtcJ
MAVAGAAKKIDLQGQAVIPGLIDSHMHMVSLAQSLVRMDLTGLKSIAAIKQALAERVRSVKPGTWILGRGWDQDRLSEKRYFTRWDLDEVAKDSPVWFTRSCGHVSVGNSKALAVAGVTDDTECPPGGVIDRDGSGRVTGIFREGAARLVASAISEPTAADMKEMLQAAMQKAVSTGLTGVHANDSYGQGLGAVPELYKKCFASGAMLRVYWDIPLRLLDEMCASPFRTGSGDDLFTYGAIKILIDGSLGGRTAALDGDYADDPGNQGVLTMTPAELDEAVYRAHSAGMQVAIHAIGDRGARLSLDSIERALAHAPRTCHRHRIVHSQILTPELYGRYKRLGVVADIQPKFTTTDSLWALPRVGAEKAETSYCWRTFLDMGIPAAGGSDSPVEPVNPLYGIYAAVTRLDMDGKPAGGWMPEQKLTVDQALRLFTSGSAYAAFEEKKKGSIEPGKMADFVVLGADPYKVPPHTLKDLSVDMTVIGGVIAHSK